MNKSLKILLAVLLLSISGRAYAQAETLSWEKNSPLPDINSVIGSGYLLIDSDFYLVGGVKFMTFESTASVWKYHIPSDTWVKLKDLPFGTSYSGGFFVVKDKGYFLSTGTNMLWEYNPLQDSWTKRANFPDAPRQNQSCFSYNGKGYVGQTFGLNSKYDSHFWEYDPVKDKWNQLASLPTDISSGSATVLNENGVVYLFGGMTKSLRARNDIWRYDIQANHWDSIGQMPGSSHRFSAFWGFDSIIIGGGGMGNGIVLGDFYKYNVEQNIWTPLVFENSFGSSSSGASFLFNRRGYYFGGLRSGFGSSNEMWSFDASQFFPPDTPTGIAQVRSTMTFSLYPNPVSHEQGFSVSTSESGNIAFYDALGRMLDERRLVRGINQVKLVSDDEVVLYRATLSSGATENGKVVFLR